MAKRIKKVIVTFPPITAETIDALPEKVRRELTEIISGLLFDRLLAAARDNRREDGTDEISGDEAMLAEAEVSEWL